MNPSFDSPRTRLADVALATKAALRATASRMFSKQDGPPDLDEVWRDFNRKLSGLFGGKGGGGDNSGHRGGNSFEPSPKSAGIGVALVAGVAALIWLGSGVFIVQEGQQAAITTFGKFSHLRNAGLQFRWPYPIQSHETVQVTQLRSESIGTTATLQSTGLRDSSMLTQDENIVDIRFVVQYKLKDARAYLYENNRPNQAVIQASESAVREVVGRNKVDAVLYEQRAALTAELVKSIQAQLDRVNAGLQIDNVNVSSVQVPEQVQAAFDDAFRANADRDRLKNEGQAYAADVVPKAQGQAARLLQEAEAHKASVVAQAEGDAQRFESVLGAYQKAPTVTRDRMYLETMQQVYANVSKVMVDSKNGSNLLYLPLDKLMQQSGGVSAAPAPSAQPDPAPAAPAAADPRSRDGGRSRDGR
jgi:modulator of FtsH protease HflK